jgi:hypothetical protein
MAVIGDALIILDTSSEGMKHGRHQTCLVTNTHGSES